MVLTFFTPIGTPSIAARFRFEGQIGRARTTNIPSSDAVTSLDGMGHQPTASMKASV